MKLQATDMNRLQFEHEASAAVEMPADVTWNGYFIVSKRLGVSHLTVSCDDSVLKVSIHSTHSYANWIRSAAWHGELKVAVTSTIVFQMRYSSMCVKC